MKASVSLCALLLLLIFEGSNALAARIGLVQRASGDVWIYSRTERARPLKTGEGIENGISIYTGNNSSTYLRFQDGQIVILQSNSMFRVRSFAFDSADPAMDGISLELVSGGMRAVTGAIGERQPGNWQLATPSATVQVSGTDFLAVIAQGLYARVNSGAISLSNNAGAANVTSGHSAYVASDAAAPVATPAIPEGLFAELDAIPVESSAGTAAAGGGIASGASAKGGIGTGTIVGIGVAAAAIAAAAGGGGSSTTTHH